MNIFKKHPDETILYTWDFTDELASGETIASATSVTVYEDGSVSTGLTVGTLNLASPVVTALVSGGVAGKIYVMDCKVLTSTSERPIVQGGLSVNP